MAVIFVIYILYVPGKSEWVRNMWLVQWFRNKVYRISYKGNVNMFLDKRTPRVYGFHPHGVHCVGAVYVNVDPLTRHIRIACTSFLFWVPVIKDFAGWGDAFSCEEKKIKSVLKEGSSIIIYPGGINEVPGAYYLREPEYRSSPDDDERYYVYKRRKGFIRVAMEQGVEVVPCWVDGEYDLFTLYHPFPRIHKWCYDHFRYPWPIISLGWKWMPFVPKPKKLTVWIGDPISTYPGGDLDEYHRAYHEGLYKLIEEVKAHAIKTQ